MPREVASKDQFKALLKGAQEIRVVRYEKITKLKVRTKEGLHTYKAPSEEADALLKGLKIPVVEF